MSLIEIKNLTLGYDKDVILKHINMDIEEKDFICIVGPNGSGKSTLVKGILGLIKPMKGKVIYNGLKQNFIGYMPQETKVDSNFPASVLEIVLSGTLNSDEYKKSTIGEVIKDTYKEFFIKVIPICIAIIVFCFAGWAPISSFGMVTFWGIVLIAVYNLVITNLLFRIQNNK